MRHRLSSFGRVITFTVFALYLLASASRAYASGFSEEDDRDEMARRASLFCPAFSNERGLPGIRAVKIETLRILLSHKYTLCPDARVKDPIGAVWNSRWGVFLWNPANVQSVTVMAAQANAFARAMDFPNELMVYDLQGKPLKGQVVPMFEPRDTFDHF